MSRETAGRRPKKAAQLSAERSGADILPEPPRPDTGASVEVAVCRLAHAEGLPLPAYQSDGAAGLDLAAALGPGGKLKIKPGRSALVPTGLTLAIPAGFEGQVRPRSGLALRHGLTVLNAPGTIDSDYRGEVKVLLVNLGEERVRIDHGDRIAQLVIAPVAKAALVETPELPGSERGEAGFGSTGRAGAKRASRKRR